MTSPDHDLLNAQMAELFASIDQALASPDPHVKAVARDYVLSRAGALAEQLGSEHEEDDDETCRWCGESS